MSNLPHVVAYTVFGVAVVAVVLVVLWARSFQAKDDALWLPFEGEGIPPGMRYRALGLVNLERLKRAQVLSIDAMVSSGCYSMATVWDNLRGSRILVQAVDTWETLKGEKVAGEAGVEAGCVVVGPSFTALCHEQKHLLEFRVEALVDYGHKAWGLNGARAAELLYEMKLREA